MAFLELFDETLDINSTENYELSVQVSFDGLSYSILDTLRNKFVLLRDYQPDGTGSFDISKLGEIISKDDFLIKRFKKVNLITPSPKSTLVPNPLFDESKKFEYFTFNQTLNDDEVILTNELAYPDATLIFSIQNSIVELLCASYPKIQLIHQLKPLFQCIFVNRRSEGSYFLHVHLEKDYLNLIIFDKSILKFCNTFHYKTILDIHYFLLYVLKRMNISQDEAVYFSGCTNNSGEIITGLSDYLRTIRFAEPTGNFTFSYVFNETELHKFLNLFSITNCE